MKLAVCLLTLDRCDLTAITVRSFVEHNRARLGDFELLHCDGGSAWPRNVEIAKRYGFRTLLAPPATERVGQFVCLLAFLDGAYAAGADWMLWLENDWQSVKPLPWPEAFREGVETVRLFGELKFQSGRRRRAGRFRIGTNELIEWHRSAVDGWEEGFAHWGGGGTAIRVEALEHLIARARGRHPSPRLKDVIAADPRLVSLRPTENVMWSIGLETTPGMIG